MADGGDLPAAARAGTPDLSEQLKTPDYATYVLGTTPRAGGRAGLRGPRVFRA